MANKKDENVIMRRPTETASLTAGGLGAALTAGFGFSSRTAAVVTFVVGALAPAYTFVVNHGGLIGLFRAILKGRLPQPTATQ